MRKGRRRRPVSLRGWWRALPFIALAGATHFAFTYLNTQRLHSEYRAIELKAAISHAKDRIADLHGKGYELGRMERMDTLAPEHALKEPRPGQIEVVRPTKADIMAFSAPAHAETPERPTRSVIVLLDGSKTGGAPDAPGSAMAQAHAERRGDAPADL